MGAGIKVEAVPEDMTEWVQVRLPKDIRDRLESFRVHEDEPLWKIVRRLMDQAPKPEAKS